MILTNPDNDNPDNDNPDNDNPDNDNPRIGSPWMTPIEASLYLGVALGTLRNWTSARFIPFAKRGRTVRYHRDKLDAWLATGACTGRTTMPDIRSAQ